MNPLSTDVVHSGPPRFQGDWDPTQILFRTPFRHRAFSSYLLWLVLVTFTDRGFAKFRHRGPDGSDPVLRGHWERRGYCERRGVGGGSKTGDTEEGVRPVERDEM